VPDPSDGAGAAAQTARAIRQAIGDLNASRRAASLPTINFGVGIHTGEVVLGAVGLPQRSDFTAIGDAVNTASRLESLCKEYQVDVVLSQDTRDRLDGATAYRELGTTNIRGKKEPVRVYTLI
jgi:adenylate cyclase